MSLNKVLLSGGGYNNKNLYNIHLSGICTVSIPSNNLQKLQIVNVEYINNKMSILKTDINSQLSTINTIVDTLEKQIILINANYIHITDVIYYISAYTNLIIDEGSIIYLPQTLNDGISINIINNSGSSITINTQNNQLIHSGFYIKPGGSTSFILETFKIAKLINIYKNNLYSWVLLLS